MNAERDKQWGQIVAKTWQDEGFKKRLLADPSAVLKEHGLEAPAGVEIRLFENTDKILNLTLPSKPSEELSEDELHRVAAGGIWGTVLIGVVEASAITLDRQIYPRG